MENKPVIILGNGLWGNLLAYRLSQKLPHVSFRLYSGQAGGQEFNSWSFRESEISHESMKWLMPFLSYRWQGYKVSSTNLNRVLKGAYSSILPGQFELLIKKSHQCEKLGNEVTMEQLLERAAFIIDTRPDPRQKSKCVRHTLGMMVELFDEHGLDLPVAMDSSVRQDGVFRHMQYLPLNQYTLVVKDVRYSKDSEFDFNKREEELLWEVRKKWKIKDVLFQETESVNIPSGKIRPWSNGRVISLAGLMNPVSGDQFTEAVRLIELMVGTSFRLGELKEVIHRYRTEKEQNKRFSRLLVKMIYHSPQPAQRLQLMEYLFKLPFPMVDKFLDGTMNFVDLTKALLGKPSLSLQWVLPSLSTKHQ